MRNLWLAVEDHNGARCIGNYAELRQTGTFRAQGVAGENILEEGIFFHMLGDEAGFLPGQALLF